ncbi:MAG: VCBS repeat-containing protein [Deltaproteobacteria bacterium]|nr:VCBS repeat-containing protein [Deltaproteobacteria bacterium]
MRASLVFLWCLGCGAVPSGEAPDAPDGDALTPDTEPPEDRAPGEDTAAPPDGDGAAREDSSAPDTQDAPEDLAPEDTLVPPDTTAGDGPRADLTPADTLPPPDARADAGADAPRVDTAPPPDTSRMDAPRTDTTPPPDTTPPDTTPPDTTRPDTTPPDTARPDTTPPDTAPPPDTSPPPTACAPAAGGGSARVAAPVLRRTLADRWQESWLASPAVEDLDRDGVREVVIPREGRLVVWRPDGTVRWAVDVSRSRIWASPVVADFVGDAQREVAVAAGGQVYLYSAAGALLPGFPAAWRSEVRGLAAGDVDGDGRPELVAVTTERANPDGTRDLVQVFRGNGSVLAGYPPNLTRSSRCDSACYITGGYDQNVAVGSLDGDARADILAPHDNAYMSWHRGSGEAFPVAPIFRGVTRAPGVRFFLDEALSRMGYAPDERSANQAHFTNSAPALADIDRDGTRDLVVLSSVQNAAQTDRLRGVALWVLHSDATRPGAWVNPFHVRTYLGGLWDLGGNIVGATNQVTVADLDASSPGLELLFAGFDGRVHCVGSDRVERWSYAFTTLGTVLTGGVLVADLSGDGRPEVLFATYGTADGAGALYVLDGRGALLHRVALPGRGAMAVPTVADVDGDGALEVVVSLKDAVDRVRSALVFTVPGSAGNCLPWPTGRANLLRNGAP